MRKFIVWVGKRSTALYLAADATDAECEAACAERRDDMLSELESGWEEAEVEQ